MNLEEVEIENYKGISHLNFNPKKINLIIGKNNTSKTSIIEAIDLLFNNEKIQNRYMGSFFNIYSKEKIIHISAKENGKNEKIELREAKEIEIISMFRKELINTFLENLGKRSKKNFSDALIKELEKVIEKNIDEELRNFLLKNSLILNKNCKDEIYYGFYDFTLIEKLENLIENIVDYISSTLPPELKKEYRKYLTYASEQTLFSNRRILSERKKFNQKQSSVMFVDENSLISELTKSFIQRKPEDSEKLHKVKKIIKENGLIDNLEDLDFDNALFLTDGVIRAHSFMFLGDGIKSIIGFLWKFSDKIDNSIILFDEPETHMHPGYTKQLVNFIIDFSKRLNIQFFIVTHSPDFLDILFSEDLEEDKREYLDKELNIIRMNKIKEETDAESLNYSEAKETREELLLDLRGI